MLSRSGLPTDALSILALQRKVPYMTAASEPSAVLDTLDAIAAAKKHTRHARQAYWLPLVLFGVIIIGSVPLYVQPSQAAGGFHPSPRPGWPAIYWLIAIPLGYLAVAAWYSFRGHRRGVTTSTGAYVAAGVGFVVVVMVGAANVYVGTNVGDLVVRGLTPTLAIAAGFGVLAWLERSLTLAAIATVFAALALTANLYSMSNIAERLGWLGYGTEVNPLVLGLFLLVAGTVVGLAKRRDTA
jgi:hypothetical protein